MLIGKKAETKIPAKVFEHWVLQGKPEWTDLDLVTRLCEMARDGECYLPKGDFQWKAYIEEIKLRMCETPQQFNKFVGDTYRQIYFRE